MFVKWSEDIKYPRLETNVCRIMFMLVDIFHTCVKELVEGFKEKEWVSLLKNDKGDPGIASVADMLYSSNLKRRTKTMFLGWAFSCKKNIQLG